MYSVKSLDRLVEEFSRLPGIGQKSAQRLAFFVSKAPKDYGKKLIEAIRQVMEKVKYCSICGNVTESDPCPICQDTRRDRSTICVVEEPWDVLIFERAGKFRGLYHVLGGAISPTKGVNPEDINIGGLLKRVEKHKIKEVILATDPNTDGQATALYIAQLLVRRGIKVTRLGMGLPVGGDLEFADDDTLSQALEGRRTI